MTILPIRRAGTFGTTERQPDLWVKCYPNKKIGLLLFGVQFWL